MSDSSNISDKTESFNDDAGIYQAISELVNERDISKLSREVLLTLIEEKMNREPNYFINEGIDDNVINIILPEVLREYNSRLEAEKHDSPNYIFYHSAHGDLTETSITDEDPIIYLPGLNRGKKITIFMKSKTLIGSKILSRKLTETLNFGLHFDDSIFKDYLIFEIYENAIQTIKVVDKDNVEYLAYPGGFNIPNVLFGYGPSPENFNTGISQFKQVVFANGDRSFRAITFDENGEPLWIPGPGLESTEVNGEAYIHHSDRDKSLITKIIEMTDYTTDREVSIDLYSSTCLYKPDAIDIATNFPRFGFIFRKEIPVEWQNKQMSLMNKLNAAGSYRGKQVQDKRDIILAIQKISTETKKEQLKRHMRSMMDHTHEKQIKNPYDPNLIIIDYDMFSIDSKTLRELEYDFRTYFLQYENSLRSMYDLEGIMSGIYLSFNREYNDAIEALNKTNANIERVIMDMERFRDKLEIIKNNLKAFKIMLSLALPDDTGEMSFGILSNKRLSDTDTSYGTRSKTARTKYGGSKKKRRSKKRRTKRKKR